MAQAKLRHTQLSEHSLNFFAAGRGQTKDRVESLRIEEMLGPCGAQLALQHAGRSRPGHVEAYGDRLLFSN